MSQGISPRNSISSTSSTASRQSVTLSQANITHYNAQKRASYEEELKRKEEREQIEQTEQYNAALKAANMAALKMKKSLEEGLVNEGLLHATKMLSELRTTSLTPKNYYSLYLDIIRKLQFLEDFFETYLTKKNAPMKINELFERVQYIGNIVPRLYLLVTMGSLYIKLREKPAGIIISDLVNMCKGVQHPTRGLFLRLYMTHKLKDKLPDKNSGYGYDYNSSIQYLIQNFMDTVNLFCRLKGDWKGEKREKERAQLKSLIGQNLEGLSHLESITTQMYCTNVLPEILNTIIKYKDSMSQEYLMLCVVSAFPDDYHIATLNMLLDAISRLQQDVDLRTILISLMSRLKNFAKTFPQSIPDDINIIESFSKCLRKLGRGQLNADGQLEVQNALLGLALTIHPNSIDYVNSIVDTMLEIFPSSDECKQSSSIQARLTEVLCDSIVKSFDSVISILDVTGFGKVMELLTFDQRRYVSNELVDTVLAQKCIFSNWEQISKFFSLIGPLLQNQDDGSIDTMSENFAQEQCKVASLLHQCENEDTDVVFKMYLTIRKIFGSGGEFRIKYTLVPLLFSYLKLADRISENPEGKRATVEKVFEYCTQTLQALSQFEPETSLSLYLSTAIAADYHSQTPYTIEMLTQAFLLFDNLDNSKKFDHLLVIFNTLHALQHLDTENLNNYISNSCQSSSKLLLKPQQCKASLLSSLLYFPRSDSPLVENKEMALARLQASTRIVKECRKPQQLPLLIDILNIYLIHFEHGNELVTSQFINGLLDLVRTNLDEAHSDDFGMPEVDGHETPLLTVAVYFEQTRDAISRKKTNPKFADIRF